jgi:hemoglobin-like flavoprotein
MADAELILSTLERVAERVGDPTPLIYQRLFAAHPELERLFAMDRDGGVRGSMVETAITCILDHVGPRLSSPGILFAARQHHEGYGVPADLFDAFFVAMRDAFRDILGPEWTPEVDANWGRLLADFAAIR